MKFRETDLPGAYLVQAEPVADARGFFARLWCREEFLEHGIDMPIVQSSVSHNVSAGTLRGLHFQWPPSREAKLVRCERGRILDVIVDLRPASPAFKRHLAIELDSMTRDALLVPAGFAHGFQTLEDNCDVVYMMADFYQPELAGGLRFDDPVLDIEWPLAVTHILPRDRDYPDFDEAAYRRQYSLYSSGQESAP